MELRVISIGALAAHPLRDERSPVRTGHATTSLVRSKETTLLVDPGLPAQAIAARLEERAGIKPEDVTHVFLTSFQPDVFRGISLFEHATWLISGTEREEIGVRLVDHLRKAVDDDNRELVAALELDVAILNRCDPAPDRLAPGVDLFPLPGVTPGLTGVLVNESTRTTLICGDAIPTVEHLEGGKILPTAANLDRARESFAEAVEIADVLILGRDNLTLNPTQRPF